MQKAANEGDVTRLIRSFGLRAFRYQSFDNRPTRPGAAALPVTAMAPPAAAFVPAAPAPAPAPAPPQHALRPSFTLLQQALAGIAPPSGPRPQPAPAPVAAPVAQRFTLLPSAAGTEIARF